jgi:rhodanese-related sulfurtransferase
VEANELLGRRTEVEVIDVREDHEWSAGHIDGARHIPLGRLNVELEGIPKDRPVVAVCRTGPRSERAARLLKDAGYSADFLTGGVTAWTATGCSLIDSAGNTGYVQDPNAPAPDAEPLTPELENLQTNFLEIAMALNARFGDRQPTDEESKAFMREWLENKGTPAEEIERILED